jgi:tryptophan halogenase
MPGPLIRDIVIVGGGTAGWMTAAALSNHFRRACSIRLVESDEIGIVGVGEATIPHIVSFNRILGIDEDEFLRATRGTFKLGIEFVNWSAIGDRYTHGFGKLGPNWTGCRSITSGCAACKRAWPPASATTPSTPRPRARPSSCGRGQDMKGSPLSEIAYAYHFDAGLYARFLRQLAERNGVERIEARSSACSSATGWIHQRRRAGRWPPRRRRVVRRLFGHAWRPHREDPADGYEDWSHWLPCDRRGRGTLPLRRALIPMTRATAHGAGWQWRIPLQHRIGNGHVYSSRFMSQEDATAILMGNLDGEPLADRAISPSCRAGASAYGTATASPWAWRPGFFEPIESTNIHLIQTSISRLMTMFPRGGFDQADIDEFNRRRASSTSACVDFIVLHYKATERDDTPFWRHCRAIEIPPTLQHKIDLYRSNGRFFREDNELFGELSWVQVMEGQRIHAKRLPSLCRPAPREEVRAFLADTQRVISKCVEAMPTHAEFIRAALRLRVKPKAAAASRSRSS